MERLIATHIAEASVGGEKRRFAAAQQDHFTAPQDSFAALSGREPERTAPEPERQDATEVLPPARDIEPQGEGDDSDGDAAPVRHLAKPTKPNSPLLAKAAALDPGKLGWRSGPQGKARRQPTAAQAQGARDPRRARRRRQRRR